MNEDTKQILRAWALDKAAQFLAGSQPSAEHVVDYAKKLLEFAYPRAW